MALHAQLAVGGGVQLGDPPSPMDAETLRGFDLVVLPDSYVMTPANLAKAKKFLAAGGRLIHRGGGELAREQDRIAPDRLAIAAPEAVQRPARQLLARIPLALAEMQQRPGREAVRQLAEQHARQPPPP